MLLLHIFIFKGWCLTWIEKMVFKMHYLSDSANFISVLTFLDHNKVDTTNRCEALKEVDVFKMFNIKTFLYQTPPYQRAQIFQIF